EIEPREDILGPWLQQQCLAMVHSWRGTGKTWFMLWLAVTIAAGRDWMGWSVPKPRRVFFIDGEMPAAALQERVAQIAAAVGTPAKGMLRFVCADTQDQALPNLADPMAQRIYNGMIESHQSDVIIV